jgi:catechol 2,3-dioxygenase-like lactoylglutathione lyase family enzyme
MRHAVIAATATLAMTAGVADRAMAQTDTLMYDHVHMLVPDPPKAAAWYEEHIGGELVDGLQDRLLFGTTRIMFLNSRGNEVPPSAGGVVDHLGFSFTNLEAKLAELEAAGAKPEGPVRNVEGLFKLAFVVDPWGTRLELVEDTEYLGFHHVHLRAPEPEAAFTWYRDTFGGNRTRLKDRLDGILYPGNVWLLFTRGEAAPSRGRAIDHIGWRAVTLSTKIEELRGKNVNIETEPRPLTLPNGVIHYAYVCGPDGARVELVERAANMK